VCRSICNIIFLRNSFLIQLPLNGFASDLCMKFFGFIGNADVQATVVTAPSTTVRMDTLVVSTVRRFSVLPFSLCFSICASNEILR